METSGHLTCYVACNVKGVVFFCERSSYACGKSRSVSFELRGF